MACELLASTSDITSALSKDFETIEDVTHTSDQGNQNLNISGYLPPAYLAKRNDPSTGQEVFTGTETLLKLDNGSYVLSDLDDAILRSELNNDGLEKFECLNMP